jgi:hypothetical protein
VAVGRRKGGGGTGTLPEERLPNGRLQREENLLPYLLMLTN